MTASHKTSAGVCALLLGICAVLGSACRTTTSGPGATLENPFLRLTFDADRGVLASIDNRLTSEHLAVEGDEFAVTTEEFHATPQSFRLRSLEKKSEESLVATYDADARTVQAVYQLGSKNHFLVKKLIVTSHSSYRLKNLVISRPRFCGPALAIVKYPHQKTVTYFGRSEKGGVFLGVEKPFDNSSLEDQTVTLGYAPSLKVKANETIESEPIYLGVYKRTPGEKPKPDLPLQSESDAMVAMTTAVLGPPRHGFAPMACGWWCEMEHYTYKDAARVEADNRSIDFLKDIGIDWFSDNHPWGGETERMNALRETDGYHPGPLVSKKYEHARKVGVRVVFWPTMNNTHPWWSGKGQPFLFEKKEWLQFPEKRSLKGMMLSGVTFTQIVQGNCIANRPFLNWINRLSLDGMRTGYFPGWVMDGDFFGGGGVITPVDCPSADHDHLPGDATWASERALAELITNVRKFKPDAYIFVCRPPMDLGVFNQKNVDAVFTIDELAEPTPLPGLGGQPVNVMLGDKVRKWSRVRVHHHFFPHYIDQPQVFVGPKSIGKHGRDWQTEAIDYVILSALSSSPNQLYYLPTKAGMPEVDKQTIHKWMDWGRKNESYLLVRKDLPDWPQAGKTDGSAHIIKDRGYVFLFNPNAKPLEGSFGLDDSIGLTEGKGFRVSSVYPSQETRSGLRRGDTVRWPVPPRGAMILEVMPEQ